jgi:hypothetical protein
MLAAPVDEGARAASEPSAWVDGLRRFFARRIHARGPTLLVMLALLSPVLVVGAALLSRPDTGKLRIAASSSQGRVDKVEVFVDGQKRCEVIPCLVEGLSPGPKFVRVIAVGFAPAQPITVAVEAGKEQFAVVSLGDPRAR